MNAIHVIEGGITAPKGFAAAGAHVGLRRKRKDLALIVSEKSAACAAVFTTNAIKGAPILWNKEVLSGTDHVRAIVVNSAYANSGTGQPGLAHAKQMAQTTAGCLGLSPDEVLVASTGIIGIHLPIDVITAGIAHTAPLLDNTMESGTYAAEAITTTDTFIKQMAVEFEVNGAKVTVGAMAKGSGMVHPNMATTLGFLTTDLAIAPELLKKALSSVIVDTFNMISVDGDTSTNDMVVLLANGLADNPSIESEDDEYELFVHVLQMMLTQLAKSVARDGEGASKLIEVIVSGTDTVDDARKCARAVVASTLVKAAVFAEDANWGRIVAALGNAGVAIEYDKLSISMFGNGLHVPLLLDGMPYWMDESICRSALQSNEVRFVICAGESQHQATAWGCDLTYDYIKKNGNYRAGQLTAKVGLVKEEGVA